jgi:hypothetical protein
MFGCVQIAKAQKELRITTPQIDSMEVDGAAIPLPLTPKFFEDKMAEKFTSFHAMKSYFIQEGKGETTINTNYFNEKGQRVLNVQMSAKNGIVLEYSMRYKIGKKETLVTATKEAMFSSIYSSSEETAKAWVFTFQLPSIRWKEEIQRRYEQYFQLFSKE